MTPTIQTRLQIIELRAEGLPYAKIAEEVKVSKQTEVDVERESMEHEATTRAIQMEVQSVNLKDSTEESLHFIGDYWGQLTAGESESIMPTSKLTSSRKMYRTTSTM